MKSFDFGPCGSFVQDDGFWWRVLRSGRRLASHVRSLVSCPRSLESHPRIPMTGLGRQLGPCRPKSVEPLRRRDGKARNADGSAHPWDAMVPERDARRMNRMGRETCALHSGPIMAAIRNQR